MLVDRKIGVIRLNTSLGSYSLGKDLIILLIMLTINKKIEDNTNKIVSVDPFELVPNLSHTSKHRNTFTAKLRPRTFFSAGKASRLEQKGATINLE